MANEQRGFVFSVVFIVVFATLLASVPVGLKGPGEEPDTVIPINPNLLTGFADSEGFNRSDFSDIGLGMYLYEYELVGLDWMCGTDDIEIGLAAKMYFLGIFWFGQIDICGFTNPDGKDRGVDLSLEAIDEDAEEGQVSYSLEFQTSGTSAGSLIVYWNSTKWDNSTIAWENEEVYLLHGMGIENTATTNIGGFIVSLLLFSLPEVPPLVNIFIAVPIWACIIYVIWFIIKEMIPFV